MIACGTRSTVTMSARRRPRRHVNVAIIVTASVWTVAAVVFVVASGLMGRAAGDAATTSQPTAVRRTRIKWLINTGNLADRWPPAVAVARTAGANGTGTRPPARCGPAAAAAAPPNSISRLQMIHGGNTAVLVMPTGDGARRCCAADRLTSQFSLGSVRLDHGRNNLYPVIRPFPDWRAFVDDPVTPPPPQPPQDDASGDRGAASEDGAAGQQQRGRRKIFNAVDAFLDDRGRILWVLDTGAAGEDACFGNTSPAAKRCGTDADEDPPPTFLAIDVQTNQIISVVSMSRVWKPGVSCFQYIVAVYPDDEDRNKVDETTGKDTNTTDTASCVEWPLVVVGDAGTNHLLVYSHSKDKFTEIILPVEEENLFYDYNEDDSSGNGNETKGSTGDGESKKTSRSRKRWPTSHIHDILYVVPLYPQMGHSRLFVTYLGCQDVYNLRLQPSTVDFSYPTNFTDDNNTDATPVPPVPVTGTLTILGRKPCKMIILGSDRRRTYIDSANSQGFVGGGTTVYFRLENTNDIWSWNTADKRKYTGGSTLIIDEQNFQLVKLGQTCRVPVAVSAGPVVPASENNDDNNDDSKQPTTIKTQQVIWMLETNFIDHFAGTADRMGANAKLQPIEEPLYDSSDNDIIASNFGDKKERPPPLRVQPDIDNQMNTPSTRCFQRENIIA